MIRAYAVYSLRFFIIVLAQVLVFDNIELNGYITPYIYILFLILLPFEVRDWVLLIIAFFLGLSVDLFSLTPGLHAASTVFVAFLRPSVLRLFSPRDGYNTGTLPRISYYGVRWFTKYSVILIFAHHFILFSLEIFRMSDFLFILSRTLVSGILTTVLILISQFLIFRK